MSRSSVDESRLLLLEVLLLIVIALLLLWEVEKAVEKAVEKEDWNAWLGVITPKVHTRAKRDNTFLIDCIMN